MFIVRSLTVSFYALCVMALSNPQPVRLPGGVTADSSASVTGVVHGLTLSVI